MNLSDRRAKKTETALYKALSELLKEKSLREITINELVNKADLHRSTFYTHYFDIYDFYKHIEDDFINILNEYMIKQSNHDYFYSINCIIDYIYENKWYYPILFGPNAENSFKERVTKVLTENYVRICAFEDNKTEIPKKWNIIAAYEIGGILNLIKYWVDTDCSFSKETLIQMIYQIDNALDSVF